jgi:hypothetical protein
VILGAICLGIAVSALWPYHNPIALVLRPGNSDWAGGPNFYGYVYLTAAFVPSALGVLGIIKPGYRALGAAFLAYLSIYLVGLADIQIAGRFLMPISIILQVGFAVYVLDVFATRDDRSGRKLLLGLFTISVLVFHFVFPTDFGDRNATDHELAGSLYRAAQTLTADIPTGEEVAAYAYSAWPVVATGQRVVSVPWPEPMILDLAQRQAATVRLFSAEISAADRIDLAKSHGVRVLIANGVFLPEAVLLELRERAVRTAASGPLLRFDLYD